MVRGASMAVTCVPWVSQWAEMHKIAFGCGMSRAAAIQAEFNSLSSMAFIGLPCPINKTGIFSSSTAYLRMGFDCLNLLLNGRKGKNLSIVKIYWLI